MTRFTDGNKVVEIEMRIYTFNGYSPDFSFDFFSVPFNEEVEGCIVDDVDYCIEQVNDWVEGIGNYPNPYTECRFADINETNK